MSELTKAFNRLFKYKKVQKNLIGFVRATEVTVEQKREGYYHPHLHVLLMVKPSYFSGAGNNYISQAEWTEFWERAAQLYYTPIVDIKAVKNKDTDIFDKDGLKKSILEVAKYPVKPIDYDDSNLQVIEDLDKGLYRKRQLAYGGLLKEIKKELALDDVENGDLVHIDKDTGDLSQGMKVVAVWCWNNMTYFVS